MKQQDLKKGTRIFYGGDMANDEGLGVIMEQITDKWGTHVNIKMDDGRDINALSIVMFSDEYKGHGGTRFVTEKAYKDFRQAEINKVEASLAKVKKETLESNMEDYCLREYGTTLAEKLEKVKQEWLGKLEETIMEEREVKAIMKAKEDAGITDLVPKPGDKIEITETGNISNEYPFWTTKEQCDAFCAIVKFHPDERRYSCAFCDNTFKTEVGAFNHIRKFHFREVRKRILETETETVEIPKAKLTQAQMKQRVIDWVEKIKDDQRKFDIKYGYGDESARFDSLYKIETVSANDRTNGARAFKFLFDGELYAFIEYYRSDGLHEEYGEAFDVLTEGTNWIQESERPGVEYFVEEI